MAHALSITDYTGTSTSLASTSTSAGYKLQSFSAIDATPEVYYNASPIESGARPIHSRAGNIVETIVVDIYGSSRDDALERLRYLQRILWEARDTAHSPHLRRMSYLSFLPDGSTNTAYSIVMGGTAPPPPGWMGADDASIVDNKIMGVTMTVEREPYWRGNAPAQSTTASDFSTLLINGSTLTPDWGRFDLSTVKGDIPGLPYLILDASATGTKPYFVVAGYSSERRAGATYDDAGLYEAEGATLSGGAATSADAGSSGGSLVSYAMSTSYALFMTGTRVLNGRYRVFARTLINGSASAEVYLAYGDESSPSISNAAVSFTGGSYRWLDLGPVSYPINTPGLRTASTSSTASFSLFAKRTGSASDLIVDFLFFMPLEYYWQSYNGTGATGQYTVYDRTIPWLTFQGDAAFASNRQYRYARTKTQGMLAIPQGNGSLYIISGTAAYLCSLSNAKAVTLYYNPLFSSARGNDG